jgi:hypothetical protein
MFGIGVDQIRTIEAGGLSQCDEECMHRQELGSLSACFAAAVTFTDACISQASGESELSLFPVPVQGVQCNLRWRKRISSGK